MHALEGPFKVFLEIGEWPLEGDRPRYQHIVMGRARLERSNGTHGRAQAPLDAVPHHGTAD
jgi:hypothetical protein